MKFFIQHHGQQTGPFSPEEIQAGLSTGKYQLHNLVWAEGMAGWLPLSQAPHLVAGTPPTVENSGMALASMILGISGFICGVTAIPAVICGHIALSRIKQSQGRIEGRGFAIAGLLTGYIGCFILLIAFLVGLSAPMIIRQRKKADQTEANHNARSFSYALMEFESEYGSFPNASTAPLVSQANNNPEITGSSSNARFRQLFQAGITQSEQAFYAKTDGSRKPDGIISGDEVLAPGECGFGYIENIRTDDQQPRPIAMTPFQPGSRDFDPKPFDYKAVVLWSDGTVRSLPIDRRTGEVILDGKNLLDPVHPIWGGVPPSLLLPE